MNLEINAELTQRGAYESLSWIILNYNNIFILSMLQFLNKINRVTSSSPETLTECFDLDLN